MNKSKLFTDQYQTGLLRGRLGWNPVSTDPKTRTKCFSLSDIGDSLLPRRLRIDGDIYWLTSNVSLDERGCAVWHAYYRMMNEEEFAFENYGYTLLDAMVNLALDLKEYESEYEEYNETIEEV